MDFDARFSWGDDPWHRLFELLHLCFLATAVVHIRPVDNMSNPSEYSDMFGFSLGVLCLAVCNVYRSVEVVFKVVGEEAAKLGERRNVINYSVQGAFYLVATIILVLLYLGTMKNLLQLRGAMIGCFRL